MKKKKTNITLRELFRKKLEYAEVTPDIALKAKIMHKAARQEFLRFNPGSFNIFYLAAIVAGGITVGILLSQGSGNSVTPVNNQVIPSPETNYIEVQAVRPIIENSVTKLTRKESTKSMTAVNKVVRSNEEKPTYKEPESKIISVPAVLNNTIPKGKILSQDTVAKNLLQRAIKSEALLIDPQVTIGCAPLKVRFHNKLSSYDSCRWTFGDGGYSLEKDPEWIFDVAGEYRVALKVYNHDNIISSGAIVTVNERPNAHFEVLPEKAILPNDEIHFLNYSSNAVRFKWEFGDGSTSDFFEPNHTYAKFSNYNVRLTVYSESGCSDSLTVINAFSGSEYFIDFPNAFIPNQQGPSGGYYSLKSDEGAQVFHPSFSGVSEYQLKIFSKLGIPIFESNDINLGWDGYNRDQLCAPGVYIWKVRGKFRNGEPFIKMGDVTLLKN